MNDFIFFSSVNLNMFSYKVGCGFRFLLRKKSKSSTHPTSCRIFLCAYVIGGPMSWAAPFFSEGFKFQVSSFKLQIPNSKFTFQISGLRFHVTPPFPLPGNQGGKK